MKMNTAQFMDKQIMDLSASGSGKSPTASAGEEFLLDLVNSHLRQNDAASAAANSDAHPPPPPPPPPPPLSQFSYSENSNLSSGGYGGGGERREEVEEEEDEEIVPSYDFHPIRPIDLPPALAPRVWASADSKSSPSVPKNYGSLDPVETVKVTAGGQIDMAGIVAEVDRAMKKHADNLLHALEGVSARLTQLETRTRGLENSVDDLKVSLGNNHGSTDGKMRQLENILREVQAGVHIIKDKQETVEAQLLLAKMHVSKSDQPLPPESQNTMNMDAALQAASAPPQSHHQLHSPVPFLHSAPPGPHPPPMVPPAAPQQNLPPSGPHPSQFPQNQMPPMPQRDPYYPPPGQTQEAPSQQYHQVLSSQPPHPPPTALPHPSHAPPTQLSAPAAPHQPYPPAPAQSLYSHQSLPSQPQPSQGHHEEAPYAPTQSFPPNVRQPASQPPGGVPPPSQQFYGAPPSVYEPQSNRSGSSFPAGYGGQPSGPIEPYPYGGSAAQYGGRPAAKQQQFSSPPVAQGGGSGYPQLPTARILPQALPTASGIDGGGSSPSGTGNRVPLDDVVDRVTNMGFPREQVRATVRRLTENGQSVDLNIVLDKLMNDGEGPTQRAWFGR